jgi:dTDP-4-dehydrorhamnose reductase
MKKVLIIGSKGMAGHVIYDYLKENTNYIISDIARGVESHVPTYQVDVTDFEALTLIIENDRPDYVINCIGILNKDAEDNPDKAILLNSYFPHYLAKLGTKNKFKLIHVSTDCVFDGKKGGYKEDSLKDGLGFYAETKALGEVIYSDHLTIRTSIIGPELKKDGIGLFHWFMQQDGEIKGYTNAYWTGITTIELAKVIVAAINQDIEGLHHVVNNETISKYHLVSIFKDVFSRENVTILPYDDYLIDKSLLRTRHEFNYVVPAYQKMIYEMKDWIIKHNSYYMFY